MIHLKSQGELERMREAGRHVGEILVALSGMVRPGLSTGELDQAARGEIDARGLESSFLGYSPGGAPPFPAVLCTSINEEIVHGIPGSTRLREGDLLKIDFGVIFESFHADAAMTVPVGAIDPEAQQLVETTRQSLYAGIKAMRAGNRLGDVGSSVQGVAEAAGYSVVRDFVGHGIGRLLHEPPQLPNFGRAGRGQRLRAGMVLAIEPMVNLGSEDVEIRDDRWTAATQDGRRSAHFEHTVAITDSGPEILTRVPGSH